METMFADIRNNNTSGIWSEQDGYLWTMPQSQIIYCKVLLQILIYWDNVSLPSWCLLSFSLIYLVDHTVQSINSSHPINQSIPSHESIPSNSSIDQSNCKQFGHVCLLCIQTVAIVLVIAVIVVVVVVVVGY